MALSGVPAKEELFSRSVCGGHHNNNHMEDVETSSSSMMTNHPSFTYVAAPSLLVHATSVGGRPSKKAAMASGNHPGKRYDVITAMNNGMLHRYSGDSGRMQWRIYGKQKHHVHSTNFPEWDDPGEVYLERLFVDTKKLDVHNHPAILVGESSLAIFSVRTGHILTTERFPQSTSA